MRCWLAASGGCLHRAVKPTVLTSTPDMKVVHEILAVKDGAEREVELDFTRHGPVLKIDEKTHRAFAIRTIWSGPGTAACVTKT